MKKIAYVSSRLALAAGVIAALAALPQSASAQLVGSFVRPGATAQQPASAQPPAMMRPGPIVRGAVPVYHSAPDTGTMYGGGTTYSNGPIYGRGGRPVSGSGYNNGGYDNGGYNNGYNGGGPVAILQEAPPYPTNNYPSNNYPSNNYPSSNYPSNNYPSGGGTYGQPSLPPIGPGNGYFNNPIPPVGPGNGYFTHPIPPVGPANGFFSNQAPITGGDPPRLGGYYYGNYCANRVPSYTYSSPYSGYDGFPQYIDNVNVVVIGTPALPEYATAYLPFYTPVYQTTYNQNNYYVATEGRVEDLQAGGDRAKDALQHAYPASSFQAAFADIAHAWTDGNIDLVRRHLRDPDTRISVFLDGKYSYSIASSDFSQITRDALDRLHTVSFDFTRLRKAKNGDVTAFGAHVYRAGDAGSAGDGQTVPFDQSGVSDDQSALPALGAEKTVYVSYTLRRYGGEWDIVATDSADHDLASSGSKSAE